MDQRVMNNYEELALDPSASNDEIRKAHRTLSRLLHPDQQADPVLRHMAELQMRRINAIVENLLDPVRRKAYDDSLRFHPEQLLIAPAAVDPRLEQRNPLLNLVGAGVAFAVLALVVMDLLTGDFTNWIGAPAPDFAVQAGSSGVIEPGRTPISAAHNRPRIRVGRLPSVRPPVTRDIQTLPPVERAATPTFDGLWSLPSSGRVAGDTDLARHAPRSIRLIIRTGDDLLFGEYTSEFASSDRATQPQVGFTFQGPARGDSAVFNWNAPDGSRGGIQLKLLSPKSMQVTWQVTELGSSLGVNGGAAILYRGASH